jgi:hypothetical protein
MKSLPIVLVHTGDSFYLKYAIMNARKFNPTSEIFLICENTTEEFDSITKLKMSDFDKYSKVLEKIYVHKNKSNPVIELFCIKRWLVLLDFMEKKKITNAFTMDSDVVLFTDVTKDSKNFAKFDYLLAKGISAGLTIINNKKVLTAYKDLVLDFYKHKIGKVEYEENGTITDMSFWKEINRRGRFKTGEITKIINSSAYDAGLLIEQVGIDMKDGMKVIKFERGFPYGQSNNKRVWLKCLHCQGPTKFYMKYFAKGNITILDKFSVSSMMWLRDNISPLLSDSIRGALKKVLQRTKF